MLIYLVRHAQAAPGHPDELRPLTADGREQARLVAERLAALDAPPRTVVSSPLLRARETAAAIAKATGAELRVDERLAPGASVELLLEAVDGAGESVVTVGHQPDCGEIAATLSGRPAPPFPPGGMTVLELDG